MISYIHIIRCCTVYPVPHTDPIKPWTIISQMVPGPFEAPELSAEPGNAGRILRVTVGVATLFFITYYQTMQLQSLITSQTRPSAYDMDTLINDIENNQTKLIMSDPTHALAIEVQT